jgi:peptide/nickel transport system substrate-binding protein
MIQFKIHRPTLLLVVLLATLALLVGACAAPAAPAGEQAPAGDAAEAPAAQALTFGMATEPVSLDPKDGLFIAERLALMNLFDTLTVADQEGAIHPGLATAWEENEDATEFTFTLRDDVTFHDGTPFNAEAVKNAFDRIVAAEVATPAGATLTGYGETEVVDDTTVRVTFTDPKPTFVRDLSQPWMGIPAPGPSADEAFGQNPVGSGPFIFVEWAPQDRLVMRQNPDYAWGPEFLASTGPARLDEVTLRFLPEPATRLTALQTGEAQVVEDPPYQDVADLVAGGDYVVETFTAPGMPSHMMLNTAKAPTDDPLVRQAMNYAVNQEELVQVAFAGLQGPAHNVLSPTTFGYSEDAAGLYRYDPEQAAALLDEAGWTDEDGDGLREKDGAPLAVTYIASPVYEGAFMELLTAYLTAAGFQVDLTTLDDAGIFEAAAAGEHNLVNMGWTSSDPGVLSFVYDSANIDGGSAFTRFVDASLDEALQQAPVTIDEAARAELYSQAQQIIMENALALPIHLYDRVMLMQSGVGDWQFDSEGYPWLYLVGLE